MGLECRCVWCDLEEQELIANVLLNASSVDEVRDNLGRFDPQCQTALIQTIVFVVKSEMDSIATCADPNATAAPHQCEVCTDSSGIATFLAPTGNQTFVLMCVQRALRNFLQVGIKSMKPMRIEN